MVFVVCSFKSLPENGLLLFDFLKIRCIFPTLGDYSSWISRPGVLKLDTVVKYYVVSPINMLIQLSFYPFIIISELEISKKCIRESRVQVQEPGVQCLNKIFSCFWVHKSKTMYYVQPTNNNYPTGFVGEKHGSEDGFGERTVKKCYRFKAHFHYVSILGFFSNQFH